MLSVYNYMASGVLLTGIVALLFANSGFAAAVLSGASAVRLRAGGVACVEFYGVPEPGGGEIAWLLDPDLYSDDGG